MLSVITNVLSPIWYFSRFIIAIRKRQGKIMLVVFSTESILAYLPLVILSSCPDGVKLTLDCAVHPKFGWRISQHLTPYGIAAVMAHESEVTVHARHVMLQLCKSLASSNHVYAALQAFHGAVEDIGAVELDNRAYETNAFGIVLQVELVRMECYAEIGKVCTYLGHGTENPLLVGVDDIEIINIATVILEAKFCFQIPVELVEVEVGEYLTDKVAYRLALCPVTEP